MITTLPTPTHQQLLEQDIHKKLTSGMASVVAAAATSGATVGSQSSSRPGILGRRREGDREVPASPNRISASADLDRDDAGSSTSGSTTLSATSSPGGAGGGGIDTLSGGEGDVPEVSQSHPSPRKKLRKQQFPNQSPSWIGDNHDQLLMTAAAAAASTSTSSGSKRKLPMNHHHHHDVKAPKMAGNLTAAGGAPLPPLSGHYIPNLPRISLLNSYRHTWRSRHNHFLRHSDVKVKEDRRPTVNELANQRQVLQKINGWKMYHLSTQMEEIVEAEVELTKKLNGLHKRLEKLAHPDLGAQRGDLGKVQELIKANLQRSKVVQDQVKESKDHALELFEHKNKVKEIVNKYVSKRQVKKREIT